MKAVLLFLTLLALPSYGAERILSNPDSNGDLKLKVTVGSTPKTALTVAGATGKVGIGVLDDFDTVAATNDDTTLKIGNGTNGAHGSLVLEGPTGTGQKNGVISFQSWANIERARIESTVVNGSNDRGDLRFYTNNAAGGPIVMNGLISEAGAWQIGATGGSATHTVAGNTVKLDSQGQAILQLDAAGTAVARLQFQQDGTNDWLIGDASTAAEPDFIINNPTTNDVLTLAKANGAATIGSTTGAAATHLFRSNGDTTVAINAPTGSEAQIAYRVNSVTQHYWEEAIDVLRLKNASDVELLQVTQDGAIEIGPATAGVALELRGDVTVSGYVSNGHLSQSSVTTGTVTSLFTAGPNEMYMVTCATRSTGAAGEHAHALVRVDSSSGASITTLSSASHSITASGATIRCTQGSGSTRNMMNSWTRIF